MSPTRMELSSSAQTKSAHAKNDRRPLLKAGAVSLYAFSKRVIMARAVTSIVVGKVAMRSARMFG